MIGFVMTRYDVSYIRCGADDLDALPTNVKPGSLAVAKDDDGADAWAAVYWNGEWSQIGSASSP